MKSKNSIAARKRMMSLSKEERSERMSKLAKIKNARMTEKQRREHAIMMRRAQTK